MDGPRAGGGGEQLRRFRHLADLTAVAIFLLIVLGGVVRVSESGLGCGPSGSGTEGWPLCGGEAVPFFHDTAVIIEFSHRVLAAIVVGLIALLAWRGRRWLGELGWPFRLSAAAGVLVLVQAALGGLTVEKNLAEELVAAHLALAMLLLGLVLWISVRARAELAALGPVQAGEAPGDGITSAGGRLRGLKPFAGAAAVLLLCAIVAGGYVAGTEKEGADGHGPGHVGAHLACGEAFPTCLDDRILPFGESRLSDIHLTHRVFVYAATAAILLLIGIAFFRGARSPLLAAALLLLIGQVLLGALNVWLGEHAALVVSHLTVATLLWASVLLIAYRYAWVPAPASARGQRRLTPEVTAPAQAR